MSDEAVHVLWAYVFLGIVLLALSGCDLALFEVNHSRSVVCDAWVDGATGLVTRYESHPPGEEDLCWRVYGDSLAPALGGEPGRPDR